MSCKIISFKDFICRVLIAISTSLVINVCAYADDGAMSSSGSPRLLNGHKTVSMESEIVNIDIQKSIVRVNCRFVFHNHGDACKVRMGFPDIGTDDNPGTASKGCFLSYVSYVDGHKVPTKVVKADPTDFDGYAYWHTKVVDFKRNSICQIEDIYTLRPGGQTYNGDGWVGSYSQISYILHTAASWHKLLTKAEINIKFDTDEVSTPLHVISLKSLPKNENGTIKFDWVHASNKGTIIYRGPSQPTIDGRTIHFVRTNFKPTVADDVILEYGYQKTK